MSSTFKDNSESQHLAEWFRRFNYPHCKSVTGLASLRSGIFWDMKGSLLLKSWLKNFPKHIRLSSCPILRSITWTLRDRCWILSLCSTLWNLFMKMGMIFVRISTSSQPKDSILTIIWWRPSSLQSSCLWRLWEMKLLVLRGPGKFIIMRKILVILPTYPALLVIMTIKSTTLRKFSSKMSQKRLKEMNNQIHSSWGLKRYVTG